MSLYRRGRLWWIELTTEQGRFRRSAGTADKKAAQELHDVLKEKLWRKDRLGERIVTWGEAVAKWLALKPRGLPDRYRLGALSLPLNATLPLSAEQIETTLAKQSGASFNRSLALIGAIHRTSSIALQTVSRRPTPRGRTRWLSLEEWRRLRATLDESSPLLRQAAEFTLATGLRENNVLELEWGQVDQKRRVAWIHADQAKAGQAIGVPLNEDALRVLGERRGVDKRLVFGNPDYALYKASNRAWYEALRRAKLVGFRWHDLRHTWASWAVMSGVRLEELQRLGGWKTAQMVQRYAHLSPEHLAEAAAKVRPVSLRYNARRLASRGTKSPQSGG